MSDQHNSDQLLNEWLHVPREVETALAGLTEDDLNLRGGHTGWSVREIVHHLVESNLVACTMVIAAGGTEGCTFDCSWLNADFAWMERLGYHRVAIPLALEMLSATCRYAQALLSASPEVLAREIKLLGTPGTDPFEMTVQQMIALELEHARHHLQEIEDILNQRQHT